MKNLTPPQKSLLDFLTDFIGRYGFAPTMREIAGHFHYTPQNANLTLKGLQRKGKIEILAYNPRGVKVVGLKNEN